MSSDALNIFEILTLIRVCFCSIPTAFVDWLNARELRHPFDLVVEPENKLVNFNPLAFVIGHEKKVYREGHMSLKILNEVLRHDALGIYFKPCSPFYEEFERQTQILLSTGLLSVTLTFRLDRFKDQHDTINDRVPAQVLFMADLWIGFLVCMIPLTLSAIAFLCEIMVPKLKNLMVSLRDTLVFLCLIRTVGLDCKFTD